jgi:hypothetical protein
MAGQAIAAARMFTKTGMASKVSLGKEITIGLVLGFAAGLGWKVSASKTQRGNGREWRAPSRARSLRGWGPAMREACAAGQAARTHRAHSLRSWWHAGPGAARRGLGLRADAFDAAPPAANRPPSSPPTPPHFLAHKKQSWHWNERRKIEEYYKTLESAK